MRHGENGSAAPTIYSHSIGIYGNVKILTSPYIDKSIKRSTDRDAISKIATLGKYQTLAQMVPPRQSGPSIKIEGKRKYGLYHVAPLEHWILYYCSDLMVEKDLVYRADSDQRCLPDKRCLAHRGTSTGSPTLVYTSAWSASVSCGRAVDARCGSVAIIQ